ncbi:DUF1573 domain-containing protein [Chryseolinea lacunae]|uniref:DUF1573 domain-containing protein n=1 Tax=Chryseolinea lacunae TaxID=2801331 RepID=A0ABS1KRZ8_9BACT|nr:DUF1573 domain-containing protein [Chryseolinea lacunae]MBL0742231.1 DUF1573 domain-containing protein [Chryseolinea lacunae]
MKKYIACLVLFACCSPLFAQQALVSATSVASARTIKAATFKWAVKTFDFGKIAANKPVTHEFTFTNTGEEPLVITSVQASCGCTVTEYSKDPIPHGAQGFVRATYNAARVGVFNKTVTVNANTAESAVQLVITGEVVE